MECKDIQKPLEDPGCPYLKNTNILERMTHKLMERNSLTDRVNISAGRRRPAGGVETREEEG